MKKNKNKYTGDLFGMQFVKCFDCSGEGEIETTPENSKNFRSWEECETCNVTGEVEDE